MIREILKRYEFPTQKNSIDIIVSIESKLKNKLPDDYKIYALNFGEHEIVINDQSVILWDVKELLQANEDYNVKEECPDIFLIGSNGGGEGIALDYVKDDNPAIVLVPLIGMEREDIVEIGDSFTDMIVRLEAGKSWFD